MTKPQSSKQFISPAHGINDAVCCPGGATVREVAKALGVSRGTVLNLEKSGIAKIKKAIKSHLPIGADLSDFY
ncbi:sigma factor-like helix-turn-helix DNA-binding protein [Polynucleobacter sp. Fuers-14]|uniref:sigma factor-like helix-turn-helix DNA-binding protein n=1 Tax=Polynucleobacter sp. Fuers-14 TaxID=1758364 RepID=UPI001C0BA833|nr:sigma factor-like helix-turn-helix DNA-binding protein [Polynucleobacter sp. Fuers-14]MBU3640964.1 hypothetical protein [Polynucleobacter sp. Fuers-14]